MAKNGLADLNRRLAAIPKRVRAAVKPALDASADELVSAQRSLAPVDDGDLRNSIKWRETGELSREVKAGGAATTVDTGRYDYDYALGVEFGTSKMAAQPFFWPGYRLVRKRVRSRIKRAVTKAVKEYSSGK